MNPLGSGARDRQVTIQQLIESKGASNAPVESWTDLLVNIWAGKKETRGLERFVADQVSAPFDAKWEIAYVPSMDPDLIDVPKTRRMIYKGRVHDIVHADEIGRRQAIELLTLSGGLLT